METYSDTERKILQAASDIFLQKGRDGARMQEIAERAGINKALLHYYFRSKEKLYQTVRNFTLRRFMENLLEAIEDTHDFHVFLRNFINNYIDYLAENEQVLRFMLWELQEGGQQIVQLMQATFREHGFTQPPFIPVIRTAIARGQIRRVDPVQFIISVIGMCVYPFIARSILENIFDIDIQDKKFLQRRKKEIYELTYSSLTPE